MAYRKVWENNNPEYRDDALARLRGYFPPGAEVRSIVTHVSQSGMTRSITVLAITTRRGAYDAVERTITDVSADVARVLGARLDDRGGVEMRGCGMDMCFALVYELSRTLYSADDAQRNPQHMPAGNRTDHGYLLTGRPL